MRHSIKYTVLLILLFSALVGCKKFIELEQPKTRLIASEVFNADATAVSAMSSIYYKLAVSGFASGGFSSVTVLASLSADELTNYSSTKDLMEFAQNKLQPGNGYVASIWSGAYTVIYQCNSVLEGVANSPALNKPVVDQLTGEALMIRAFSHFCLKNLYGDVPYIRSTDYRENTKASRMPEAQVMELIIADLERAKALLNADYGAFNGQRVRVNKWAATALLARAYLYAGNSERAAAEAGLVIGQNGLFKLLSPDEVFLKNSLEAVWQINPSQASLNTNEGSVFILNRAPANFALSQSFVDRFEAGDLRKTSWVGTFSSGASSWSFPFKYKVRTGGTPLNEYSMVLRLAELYLIRAEARANLNDLAGSIADVDEIRLRAGLKKIAELNPGINKSDLLKVIEQERRSELFTEWGHRRFDLRRTGKSDALLPIPLSELKLNANLVQNEGYK